MSDLTMNEAILELVKSVSALEARTAGIDTTLHSVQTEVQALKTLADKAQGFSVAARAVWGILGLLLGAGGFKIIEIL